MREVTGQMQVESLSEHAFAAYGRVLGEPFPGKDPASAFSFATSDFWQASRFDPGQDGQTEVLWVTYRNDSLLVSSMEVHWLTEQAIVPLQGGELIHVVAAGDQRYHGNERQPDLKTIRAFHIPAGQGVSMNPGCWHASFSTGDEVLCLMLTRASTTRDLVQHLRDGVQATETSIVKIEPMQFKQVA